MEEVWRITKNYVAYENDGRNFLKVRDLIFEGLHQSQQSWYKLVDRTRRNEMNHIRLDKITDVADTTNQDTERI
jgi:hypothetical protein